MTRRLVLPSGHTLLVDEEDWPMVSRHKWHAVPARTTRYAQSIIDHTPYLLHRILLSPKPGLVVDHRNLNGLDNRRRNLRVCTQSQNKANAPIRSTNTSGYKGVSRTAQGKWHAYITVNYKRINLGYFTDPWAAAQAYNAAAIAHWGEFALLNIQH